MHPSAKVMTFIPSPLLFTQEFGLEKKKQMHPFQFNEPLGSEKKFYFLEKEFFPSKIINDC